MERKIQITHNFLAVKIKTCLNNIKIKKKVNSTWCCCCCSEQLRKFKAHNFTFYYVDMRVGARKRIPGSQNTCEWVVSASPFIWVHVHFFFLLLLLPPPAITAINLSGRRYIFIRICYSNTFFYYFFFNLMLTVFNCVVCCWVSTHPLYIHTHKNLLVWFCIEKGVSCQL